MSQDAQSSGLSSSSVTGEGTAPQQSIISRCFCFVYSALLTAAVVSRPEMFTALMFVKNDFSGLFIANYLDTNHNSALAVTWSLACSGTWSPGMRYCSLKEALGMSN